MKYLSPLLSYLKETKDVNKVIKNINYTARQIQRDVREEIRKSNIRTIDAFFDILDLETKKVVRDQIEYFIINMFSAFIYKLQEKNIIKIPENENEEVTINSQHVKFVFDILKKYDVEASMIIRLLVKEKDDEILKLSLKKSLTMYYQAYEISSDLIGKLEIALKRISSKESIFSYMSSFLQSAGDLNTYTEHIFGPIYIYKFGEYALSRLNNSEQVFEQSIIRLYNHLLKEHNLERDDNFYKNVIVSKRFISNFYKPIRNRQIAINYTTTKGAKKTTHFEVILEPATGKQRLGGSFLSDDKSVYVYYALYSLSLIENNLDFESFWEEFDKGYAELIRLETAFEKIEYENVILKLRNTLVHEVTHLIQSLDDANVLDPSHKDAKYGYGRVIAGTELTGDENEETREKTIEEKSKYWENVSDIGSDIYAMIHDNFSGRKEFDNLSSSDNRIKDNFKKIKEKYRKTALTYFNLSLKGQNIIPKDPFKKKIHDEIKSIFNRKNNQYDIFIDTSKLTSKDRKRYYTAFKHGMFAKTIEAYFHVYKDKLKNYINELIENESENLYNMMPRFAKTKYLSSKKQVSKKVLGFIKTGTEEIDEKLEGDDLKEALRRLLIGDNNKFYVIFKGATEKGVIQQIIVSGDRIIDLIPKRPYSNYIDKILGVMAFKTSFPPDQILQRIHDVTKLKMNLDEFIKYYQHEAKKLSKSYSLLNLYKGNDTLTYHKQLHEIEAHMTGVAEVFISTIEKLYDNGDISEFERKFNYKLIYGTFSFLINKIKYPKAASQKYVILINRKERKFKPLIIKEGDENSNRKIQQLKERHGYENFIQLHDEVKSIYKKESESIIANYRELFANMPRMREIALRHFYNSIKDFM